jgi:hypothetical protein
MDSRTIDRISKTMVVGLQRRTLVRGVAGATLATLGFSSALRAEAKSKLYVCCPPEEVGACPASAPLLLTPQEAKAHEELTGEVCKRAKLKKKAKPQ